MVQSTPQPDVWEIIAALTAVAAIVISLGPYVANLFKGRKLRVTTQPRCILYHYMGHPNVSFFLDLYNVGGQTVTVAQIDCFLKGDKYVWHLPVQTYYSQSAINLITSQQPQLILGSITLKPDEHWRETIRAQEVLAESDEQARDEIAGKIKQSVNAKLKERSQQVIASQELVEAAQSLVDEANAYFNGTFRLTKGTYQLVIALISDTNQLLLAKAYELTLYETTIRDLRDVADGYKYGAGGIIYWDQTRDSPSPILRVQSDELATNLYRKLTA